MRIAGYIEKPGYHVTVFEMNHRFSIKIESEGLEQWYKIRTGSAGTKLSEIEEALGQDFWEGVAAAFRQMRRNELKISEYYQEAEEEDFDIL